MSYDIRLVDPVTGEDLHLSAPHLLRGGTYAAGGTTRAWLNITWNYARHFYALWPGDGIRTLYGKSAVDTIPLLEAGIAKLGDDAVDDYWSPTEGNAKRALVQLLTLAKLRPDGIWQGD